MIKYGHGITSDDINPNIYNHMKAAGTELFPTEKKNYILSISNRKKEEFRNGPWRIEERNIWKSG